MEDHKTMSKSTNRCPWSIDQIYMSSGPLAHAWVGGVCAHQVARWGRENTGNRLPSFPQVTACCSKCERTEMRVRGEFPNIRFIKRELYFYKLQQVLCQKRHVIITGQRSTWAILCVSDFLKTVFYLFVVS